MTVFSKQLNLQNPHPNTQCLTNMVLGLHHTFPSIHNRVTSSVSQPYRKYKPIQIIGVNKIASAQCAFILRLTECPLAYSCILHLFILSMRLPPNPARLSLVTTNFLSVLKVENQKSMSRSPGIKLVLSWTWAKYLQNKTLQSNDEANLPSAEANAGPKHLPSNSHTSTSFSSHQRGLRPDIVLMAMVIKWWSTPVSPSNFPNKHTIMWGRSLHISSVSTELLLRPTGMCPSFPLDRWLRSPARSR